MSKISLGIFTFLKKICSTQLCGGFLALSGGLNSSSSMQWIFCVDCSTCTCVFLMCLWEKVRAMSYSSAILILLHRIFTIPFLLSLKILKYGNVFIQVCLLCPKQEREKGGGGGGEIEKEIETLKKWR